MTKRYEANFGTVTNLRITQSRGVPMAAFTLDGGEKFSRDVIVFGAERVEAMKAIGNGRKAWVRGEVADITKKNAQGGTYQVTGLKGYNIKDITDSPARTSEDKDAAQNGDQADENAMQASDNSNQADQEPAEANALKGEVPF
jgi:hypothetical protein